MTDLRERTPRADEERWARRRRQPGTLNRLTTSNLDIPPECLDPEYHYHWVNDRRGRVQSLTMHDDYDIVTVDELAENAKRNRAEFNFNRDAYTSGAGDQVTIPVERDGTKAVLLKKPKAFYDHDYEQGCAGRQAMMEARVYEGDLSSDVPDQDETLSGEVTYVPKENTLGGTAPRRRGRIPNRLK